MCTNATNSLQVCTKMGYYIWKFTINGQRDKTVERMTKTKKQWMDRQKLTKKLKKKQMNGWMDRQTN